MTAWISLGIACLAVGVATLSFVFERRQRRFEIDLLRRQVDANEGRFVADSQAHVTVRQGTASGGLARDSYTFNITNAGQAFARHITIELRDQEFEAIVASGRADSEVLAVGGEGVAIVELSHELRGKELAFEVAWVDPSCATAWVESGLRRRRDTGLVLDHVTTLP